MFNYFLKHKNILQYTIKKYTRLDYIRNRYKSELDRIVNYYRHRDRAVNNNHIISRLINTVLPNIDMDVFNYLNIVTNTALLISKQFNITSNINYGKVHKSIFYGENANEILLYTENIIDINYIENNYANISPIKMVYSEDDALDYYLPICSKDFSYNKLFVYEIDIITMMLQYKYWALDRQINFKSTNINVFVATIILPNMMYSIFEFSMFNRFINISNSIQTTPFLNIHPYNVLDFTKELDLIYKKIYKDAFNTNIELTQLLLTIPVLNNTAYSLLKFNTRFYTAQSEWVLRISRIFYILDLLLILDKNGMKRNRDIINDLPVTIRQLKNRSTNMEYILPRDLFSDYLFTIDEIGKIVGKR